MKKILFIFVSFVIVINCFAKQYNEVKNIDITYDTFIYKYVFNNSNIINVIDSETYCNQQKVNVNIFSYNDYNNYAWCYNDTLFIIAKINDDVKQILKKAKVPNLFQKDKNRYNEKVKDIENNITLKYTNLFCNKIGKGKGYYSKGLLGDYFVFAERVNNSTIYFSLNMNNNKDIIFNYSYLINIVDSKNQYPSINNEKLDCHIFPGKHIYLKLQNNEIISLVCKYNYRPSYVDGGFDYPFWYTIYNLKSGFILDKNTVDKLLTQNIIKIRLELQNNYVDIDISAELSNIINNKFKETYNKLNNDYLLYLDMQNQIKTDSIMQQNIKLNPLYNF